MSDVQQVRRKRWRGSIAERLWPRVNKSDSCWIWLGGHTSNGYGSIRHNGKSVRVHRVVYELLVGKIPPHLQCDHLCRNKLCVNPSHIELVSQKINILRGISFSAVNAKKTHCRLGHPYSGHNLIIYRGERRCRICMNAQERRSYNPVKQREATQRWKQKKAARAHG